VECRNAVFGDPAPGVLKSCQQRFATTSEPGPIATTSEPGPIANQGYSRVFSDEFDTLDGTLGTAENDNFKWNNMWYRSAPPAGSIAASNGVLRLNSRRSDGFPDLNISTRRATQGGSSAWTYGYFEARMRWTGGQGHWPAFWLLNLEHAFLADAACPTLNSELDIFEGQGSQPNRVYTALHRNTSNRCSVPNTYKPFPNWWDAPSSTTGTTWHTFSALWTSSTIKWYFDGVQINQTTPHDSTHAPMFVVLQSDAGGWEGDPNATTPDNLVTEFDWVRVWQR
jgi:hypothetical protein